MQVRARCPVLVTQAETAAPPKRASYSELAELVRPWMSPRVLEHADSEILLDLLNKCENAGRMLEVKPWYWTVKRAARNVLFWTGTVVLVVLVGWLVYHWWPRASEWLSPWSRPIVNFIYRASATELILASIVIILALALYLVYRGPRGR